MVIFLYGSDSFRSRAKLNQLIEQFKKQRDPRGNNVVKVDGAKTSLDEINSKIASASLLAEKRLLVVEELFSHREETIFKALLAYLWKIEKDENENSLIFYEPKELESKKYGEKRLTAARKQLFDYLAKQKFSEQFKPLNANELSLWIKQYLNKKNMAINPAAVNLLTNISGADLWGLHNELDKLTNFVQRQNRTEITAGDLGQLVSGTAAENIFALTDALGSKNKALFFSLLENQLDAGVSLQQVLALVARQFKITLQVKEYLIAGQAPQQIAAALKLHPFVVQKTIPQTRNFSLDYLKNVLGQIVELDYKIKTGQRDGLTGLTLLFSANL